MWLSSTWGWYATALVLVPYWSNAQRADLPERPVLRYRAWGLLTAAEQTIATNDLSYTTPDSWNVPSTNLVELIAHGDLAVFQQNAAATVMGIAGNGADEVWDCWINHFDGFDWSDMVQEGVSEYYEVLGWTQAVWDEDGTPPATDDLDWIEPSTDEQEAAVNLCYTAELWDQVSLEALSTPGPTSAPTTQAPTTEDFTRSPTMSPTVSLPTVSPTETPTTTFVPPPVPPRRYVNFNQLTSSEQTAVEQIGYTVDSWNVPGTASLELLKFDELAPSIQSIVTSDLGWTPEIWNCHINHFQDYFWSELNTEVHVQQFFVDLGWNASSWAEVIDPPPSESADWSELTANEQAAAEKLCYFEELWNGLDLTEQSIVFTDPPNTTPTTSPDSPASIVWLSFYSLLVIVGNILVSSFYY